MTLSVAIPVLAFLLSLYLLNSWLISHLTINAPLQFVVFLLPAVAGVLLWVSLLAAPMLIIVPYELGARHTLDPALARTLIPAPDGARWRSGAAAPSTAGPRAFPSRFPGRRQPRLRAAPPDARIE